MYRISRLLTLFLLLSFGMLSGMAQTQKISVGVMLPLNNDDGDGRRMVEYYRGMLLAVEDLKKDKISVDVHAWNVTEDVDAGSQVMNAGAENCDVIFGPLYSSQVMALSAFCRMSDIKLVIPFSITSDEVESNSRIYQVYQSNSELEESAIQAFFNRFGNAHPVFVDCADSKSDKGNFTSQLRKKLEAKGTKYSLTSIKSAQEDFQKAFSIDNQNVVILNSPSSPLLTKVIKMLDKVKENVPSMRISLYGYTEWLMYTAYNNNTDNFFKYDTYIPSTFYYNASHWKTIQLERRYKEEFGEDMMKSALPRFALMGYDHAQFFLRGLLKYGKSFTGSKWQQPSNTVQNPLKFVRTQKGGFRNKTFLLIHYGEGRQIESLSY